MSADTAVAVLDSSSPRYRRTIRQILRVDYAGEYAAIRIYGAQIALASRMGSPVTSFLEATVAHERRHAEQFRALMPARDTRPCAATPLWGVGGSLLGLLTALQGSDAMMVCTEAVERTVHAHLNLQLAWLNGRDPDLVRTIVSIRDEEVGHHDDAQRARLADTATLRLLDRAVAVLTSALIWCSTYGALTRMKVAIAP